MPERSRRRELGGRERLTLEDETGLVVSTRRQRRRLAEAQGSGALKSVIVAERASSVCGRAREGASGYPDPEFPNVLRDSTAKKRDDEIRDGLRREPDPLAFAVSRLRLLLCAMRLIDGIGTRHDLAVAGP
jgi:hypothetical protein